MLSISSVLAALLLAGASQVAAQTCSATIPSTPGCTATVNGIGGYTFVGQVGFGTVGSPSDSDTFGDTLGGIGSAISIVPGTFRRTGNTYTGQLYMQPDRGHNSGGAAPVDYPARRHVVSFTLNPYYGSTANGGIGSLSLSYQNTQIYVDPFTGNLPFSGQNPTAVRAAQGIDPFEPVSTSPKYGDAAVSFDAEGLAVLSDGTFYASEEYAPYIHYFNTAGVRQATISPPQAIIPHNADGTLNFDTTNGNPSTGRVPNQGLEALTVSADNTRLYAIMQSGLVQDIPTGQTGNGPYTRMLVYDISTSKTQPTLIEEYVLTLPTVGGAVLGQSEMMYVSPGVFLVLPRDGRGNGNGNAPMPSQSSITSQGKNAALITTVGATNIAGLFDGVGQSILVNGALNPAITPITIQPFVEYTNSAELAKFGLQNGQGTFANRNQALPTDIVGKFESLALVSLLDPTAPNDYFLFSAADNDFITANGHQSFNPTTYQDAYATGTGQDVPNQVFVFRVTLPNAQVPNYLYAAAASPGSRRSRARRELQAHLSFHQMDQRCPLGLTMCANECIDMTEELAHCGACGHDCTTLAGVDPNAVACVAGQCSIGACLEGFSEVDGVCV